MPPKRGANNASRDVARLSRANHRLAEQNSQLRNQGTEHVTWNYERETVRTTPKGTHTFVQERGTVDYVREPQGQWNNVGSSNYSQNYNQPAIGYNQPAEPRYQGARGGADYSVTNVTCTRGGGGGGGGRQRGGYQQY